MSKKISVVTIDTGVPIPDDNVLTYPTMDLKVGESFVFPIDKRPSVQSKASRIKRETGRQFIVRKQGEGFARLWRSI